MTRPRCPAGRRVTAELDFAAGGGRTVLARQHVPYPFHITRPFRLDAGRPDLATLYLQSASGGLYRGDDLTLRVSVRRGAAAHLATQAATIVHATGPQPARQRLEIAAAGDAFLACTPDPFILFPEASFSNETCVTIGPRACVILADAFASHDPQGGERPFGAMIQRLEVKDETGRILVSETGRVAGAAVVGKASPLGPFKACGSLVVLAPRDALPVAGDLSTSAAAAGALAGVSTLPNSAGLLLRCLGRDGGVVRGGLEAAFEVAFQAATGVRPAPRRR